MTKILTIFLLCFSLLSYGQIVNIETLRVPTSGHFKSIASDKMNYPIVRTGKREIDALINTDIRNRLTNNEYSKLPIKRALKKWAAIGITFIDFEVSCNKNGIISLNISVEGCAAYCTSWTEFFNYSTITGKPIGIETIIDTAGSFRDMVLKSLHSQFDNYRQDLKKQYDAKEEGLDKETYDLAIEYSTECENSFSFETFRLYNDSLEIIKSCYVPHIMLPLTPYLELKYDVKDIRKHLKTKNWP